MYRPLRIEFPGAVHHVTSRGDRREPIYRDDIDRLTHLDVIAQAMDRFDAQVLAYCLMGNHYHLVLYTRLDNLSRVMRHINGVYTQAFNRRHGLVGHLLQGRFKAILVDRDAYLLALCRYVERNPVAASLVAMPGDWPWSSYQAHVGAQATPPWLDSDGLHAYLLGREVRSERDRQAAEKRYAALVDQGEAADASFWQDHVQGQIFLGDDAFAERSLAQVSGGRRAQREVPKAQRRIELTWADWLARADNDRDRGLYLAYRQGAWTMTALAREAALSVSHVSRVIARVEREEKGETTPVALSDPWRSRIAP
jgi:REP element-mobilizing transposase RayT